MKLVKCMGLLLNGAGIETLGGGDHSGYASTGMGLLLNGAGIETRGKHGYSE